MVNDGSYNRVSLMKIVFTDRRPEERKKKKDRRDKKEKKKKIPKESLVEQMKRLAWFGANALEDLFISFK